MNEHSNSEQDPGTTQPPPPPAPPAPPDSPAAPAAPAAPPPPPPGQTTARLVRSRDDKVIAGVCGGLAAYTGTDPALWRIGFVLGAIFGGGLGLIAYVVLWLATPEARPGELPAAGRSNGPQAHSLTGSTWVAIALIVLGVLVVVRGFFDIFDFLHGGVLIGLILVGVGIAIWARDGSPKPPRPAQPPRPPAPAGPQRASWAAPAAEAATPAEAAPAASPSDPTAPMSGVASTWPGHTPAPTTPLDPTWPTTPMASVPSSRPSPVPAAKRREPSLLGRFVVGAAALAIGLALIIDETDIASVEAKAVVAVLLGIVGTGLLVGTWIGRARWLIFPGAVLALMLIVMTAIPFHIRGGWGELAWSPQAVEEIAPSYEHSAGQAALDLSHIEFGRDDDVDIDVRLGFGELYVVLPDEPDVRVRSRVQAGEIDLFGRVADGWDIRQEAVDDGEGRRPATVTIDARVTFGEVHVLRGTTSDVPGLVQDRFEGNFRNRFGE